MHSPDHDDQQEKLKCSDDVDISFSITNPTRGTLLLVFSLLMLILNRRLKGGETASDITGRKKNTKKTWAREVTRKGKKSYSVAVHKSEPVLVHVDGDVLNHD